MVEEAVLDHVENQGGRPDLQICGDFRHIRITDDETIEQAKHTPPQTTRARLRGEFIRQANLKGKDYRVDWVYLKLNDPERETILCKDPFQSHDERVARLIRSF